MDGADLGHAGKDRSPVATVTNVWGVARRARCLLVPRDAPHLFAPWGPLQPLACRVGIEGEAPPRACGIGGSY